MKVPQKIISTHILTRRMTHHPWQTCPLIVHFNSHPHKEDDRRTVCFIGITYISTHILIRRMTTFHDWSCLIICISTHILIRRMTMNNLPSDSREEFQLTSSRRGWRWSVSHFIGPGCISTHILAKRMTLFFVSKRILLLFQLTSSRRGWPAHGDPFRKEWSISTHILAKRMTPYYDFL